MRGGGFAVISRSMIFAFACTATLASCRQQTARLDNLACDGTKCISGYSCDPVSSVCVQQPVVGCNQSSQVCPTTTQTGGACTLAGFTLPCSNAVTDCGAGACRTCQNDHTWSSCTKVASSSAGGGSSSGAGSSSGTGGTGGSQPGAILSVVSGSGQAFGKGARAIAIGQPIIGKAKDASGSFTSGFAATVQP